MEDINETLASTVAEAYALKHECLNRRKNSTRNKPCPCGSKLKFKKCCWSKITKYSNILISEAENDPRNQ
jgi:hypothetical protein